MGPDEKPGIWYEAGYVARVLVGGPSWDYPNHYGSPGPPRISAATDPQGVVVDWQWTLNYGYGPNNEIIYGLDPGPPLPVYDMTADTTGAQTGFPGGSIPGITGTPLDFPSTWLTLGGLAIGDPPATGPGTGGANQPTWSTSLPADVVGITRNQVNWGLMTFQDKSAFPNPLACTDDVSNYDVKVPIVSDDSGDVSAIEDYMRLKYHSGGAHPGLSASGGTPTKRAISLAGDSITTSWNADPKKQCLRPWGIILCTDGQSNTCNTGSPSADDVWGANGNPACEADIAGSDYLNYPPGSAEAVYNLRLQFGAGDIIKPRTYAIGIAQEVGRCELDRIAYRGRSDARAARGDAGFLLYDPNVPPTTCALVGDADLPHIDPPTLDESAATPDRLRQDNGGAGPYDSTKPDYAFFALDTTSIVNAFLQIVAATAAGDYSTSAPVSGGGVSLGSIVLLPSTEYPSWKGHLRAYDTSSGTNVLKWDAADVLNNPAQPWQPTPDKRAIYTWDPATGTLIPVTAANLASLVGLAGGDPAFTANVVDFIRGFDGTLTNTPRFKAGTNACDSTGWLLGPVVNSTPAVVGGPYQYKQFGNVADHRPFEAVYAARRPLAWAGSDDGLLHAFDFYDGTEVIALLPPNLLANEIKLYANYVAGIPMNEYVTGQVSPLDQHIWGVANSLRFTDVYSSVSWPDGSAAGYKTVGFLTEGPGGDLIAAIDVTHVFPGYPTATPPVPNDPNYDSSNPVTILWTKNSSDYTGLFGSWSVPAVAADNFSTNRMFFGAGVNPASLLTASVDATAFVVDPTDGTLNHAVTLTKVASPSPLVGQQSFADGVFFQTKVPGYLPDNIADLSLTADLNGQIWFNWKNGGADFSGALSSAVGIDLNSASGTVNVFTTDSNGITTVTSGAAGPASPQPDYYSPAATGQGTSGCQIYAMASGSLYETSPTVSGWNVNRSGSPPSPYDSSLPVFTPYLYVGVGPNKIGDLAFGAAPLGKDPNQQYILKQRIGGEVPDAIPLPPGDPALATGQTKLGPRTQVTSSPIMVVDSTGTGAENAIFLLYDPDTGCNGTSYVVILTFQSGTACTAPTIGPASGSPNTTGIVVLGAGPGAASGITFTNTGLVAAQSGVGPTASASLVSIGIDIKALAGVPTFQPVWWRDVK